MIWIYLGIFLTLFLIWGYDLIGQIKYRKFPGKMESFIFGSQLRILKIGQYYMWSVYGKRYGETFVLWQGRQPRMYTSDPNVIRKMSSFYDRAYFA